MKKALKTNQALILFTLLFIVIAACSFAAFQKTEQACCQTAKCNSLRPSTSTGEMIWDVFSRRFISLVSLK